MNYYRARDGEFGKTWAILNEKGEIVLCDWRTRRRWLKEGGEHKSKIKQSRVGQHKIETQFDGQSSALDGPHRFWKVSVYYRPPVGRGQNPIIKLIKRDLAIRVITPEMALHTTPPLRCHAECITLEEALKFHEAVRKHISTWMQNSLGAKPEKAQELLAELSYWCEQKWGRQAEVAREIGTTPQRVNDWLGGRKKMTGEQALRVREFLLKARRARR